MGTDYRTRPYYGITVCDTVCICTIWLTQRIHLQDCAERRADLRYRLVAELLVYHTHCMRLDGKLRGSTTRWAVRVLCRGSEA